ncbi:NYN domain-containing protein [Thalassospiraceae bacterium SW-3-3]|nr:NYN domain-containing protein [Thalassospiraceae bacterium SW-3-3]
MSEIQEEKNVINRAAVYIDGFNLYHPIHEMDEPHLKWCDLWKLSETFCHPKALNLVKVVFCTAVPQFDVGKRDRHNTFNTVQLSKSVTILKGHHVFDPTNQKYSEKQSDINVALSLMMDGVDDIYDYAFLVSADSDQAATAKFFHERFDNKKLILVAPPGKQVPKKAQNFCETSFTIKKETIESCVMEKFVPSRSGALIRRPEQYAPPADWTHPDKRPKVAKLRKDIP